MLLLLYGEESFLKLRKLQEIKERYLNLHKGKFYLRTFDCSQERDASEILQEIRGTSLFQEKKLIVLGNLFSSKALKEILLEHKDELLNTAQAIVFFEEGEIGKEDALLLFVKAHGKLQEFSPLQGKRLLAWVQEEFGRCGGKPSFQVLDVLIRTAGNDLWRLSHEIQKLATFKSVPSLTRYDVEALVEPMVASDIFATIDAISTRNKKQALSLLGIHEKHGDSLFYILSMLGFQFRTLLAVKEMINRSFPYSLIVQKTRMHPYVVKKAYEAVQNFTLGELQMTFRRIFDIELGLKTGVLEPSSALSWFILGK